MQHRIACSILLVASALAVGFLVGCASLRTASCQADSPVARAQIENCLEEIFTAASAKDFNRLDSYHLYGPKFSKFSDSSAERLDASAGCKGEHDGLAAISGLKMRAGSLKIDIFGDVGIATFILSYSFDFNGEAKNAKERTTMVFVKEGAAWKIAHEHLSPIKP